MSRTGTTTRSSRWQPSPDRRLSETRTGHGPAANLSFDAAARSVSLRSSSFAQPCTLRNGEWTYVMGADSQSKREVEEQSVPAAISREMVRIYKEQFGRG